MGLRSDVIELDHSDGGLDRKQLKRLKQRFLDLNRVRHRRMLEGLSDRQQDLVVLLPLLFHVNHPMLPGYVSGTTPAGLSGYEPDRDQIRLARGLARSFHYQRDVSARACDIDALFVMGSVGTIAQSEGSDLDVWVCHRPGLEREARDQLRRKCRQLSLWAEQQVRLEVHFFLMEPDQFRTGQLGQLSAEGSGSAQRFLLLDEFYRTALWLGGKLPLWWFVPGTCERDYAAYTQTLLGQRFLRAAEVIDFGGLPDIPTDEFVGAGIWHLYKGIESPHKSVLKLMLLEAYLQGQDRRPLALTFKEAVYQQAPHPDRLDAYVMIYRRLEQYLIDTGDVGDRLNLARRCLYFKVDKPLTRPPRSGRKSWQREQLEQLVAEWGWSHTELQRLDQRRHWKVPDVMEERRQLVAELSASYRLINAVSKASTETRISDDELMVLGRKLHAAFERKAGKVEWLNPDISQDIAEPALIFVEEPDTSPEGARFWAVFRSRDGQPDGPPLKRARYLGELLLWTYGNGVLGAGAWFDVQGERVSLTAPQRQQLWQWLHQWLPLPLVTRAHEPFQRAARAERLLLLFNLGVESQANLHERGLQMLSAQRDALDFSGLRDNLVLTLDLVQINSWREVLCRHYDDDALINGLQYYLRLAPPGRGLAPPEVTIRCLGAQGNLVVQRLEELWQDLVGCYYSGTRPASSRYVLETAEGYVLIQFLQQQPHVTRYGSYDALIDKLTNAQLEYSPIVVDRHALKNRPLKLMADQAREPGVYLFYQVQEEEAEVTLIDELGSLLVIRLSFFSHTTLLRPLHHFLRSVVARQSASADQGGDATPPVRLFELCGRVDQGRGYLEERASAGDLSRLTFTNIQVIAEPAPDGDILYTVYCNDREFSALDYGDELFSEVARYILSMRRAKERYPCYITDLDLSQCRDLLAPQLGLQLSHYLDIKAQLEQRLNRALMDL
ncbi:MULTISPECIES: class I adenylate cyclase [unclassified Marinimicrobium]|uniref:class I adenylate cyclase n=1 Tax=unclassified Marinimicrobium TaxID=2632100 RepID=UPI000C3B6790|nr:MULTISPECIES: class I adenylate cyclase [unclassified Marinimicrobium]MAN52461.1 adenylate cyclase [Marinimicrobium sp.]